MRVFLFQSLHQLSIGSGPQIKLCLSMLPKMYLLKIMDFFGATLSIFVVSLLTPFVIPLKPRSALDLCHWQSKAKESMK